MGTYHRYSHSEFVYGPEPGGPFKLTGYSTPCIREVINGLQTGDHQHVNHYAFRAARESDLMRTLLWETVYLLRAMARQKNGPDLVAQAAQQAAHMQRALKVIESLIDPDGAQPRTFDDADAKHCPRQPLRSELAE